MIPYDSLSLIPDSITELLPSDSTLILRIPSATQYGGYSDYEEPKLRKITQKENSHVLFYLIFFALGPHPCYDTIFIKAINDLLLNPLDTFQPYYRPIGINWPHFILSLYSTLCSMSLISSDFIPFLLYNSFNFWFHSFFHMFLESWYLWGTFSQSYPFLIRTVSVVVIHSHRC